MEKNLLFMSEMDKLCIKFKLLPSIIKDSRLEKNIVENCYEEFSVFKKNLRIFDKKRFYQSEVSKKLGLNVQKAYVKDASKLDKIKLLSETQVDAIITDPPYANMMSKAKTGGDKTKKSQI